METIAAISTALGYGGIGIVRISGDESLNIVNKIFKSKKTIKDHEIVFGRVYDNNEIVDEVLVSYFKSPHSYTGEDTVEINSHGGIIVLRRILELVLKNGAQMAEPGEFTKRAFMNGKMDLTQAESVIDIINSKSTKQNKISVNQLEGKLGAEIKNIKNSLFDVLVDLEANIDYPEYDIEEISKNKVAEVTNSAIKRLAKLSDSFYDGNIIKNGVNVAIVGKPNVGKSSLLNTLLDKNRAIVSDIPGTTRDTIEETIIINGICFNFVDTAGIRSTTDDIEKIGVDKSFESIDNVDVVILLLDLSKDLNSEDQEIIDYTKDKKRIIVANKADLETFTLDRLVNVGTIKNDEILTISTKENDGIEELKNRLTELFDLNTIELNDENIITNERHKLIIDKALEALINVKNSINDVPLDMISIDIQNAIKQLCELTGESVSEEVINGIFKKFCLGK